jgi:hypothetical protein
MRNVTFGCPSHRRTRVIASATASGSLNTRRLVLMRIKPNMLAVAMPT